MPALKTPKYTDHPAEKLSKLIPQEFKDQFLKTPKTLLIENPIYLEKLKTLRNHFNYSYLIQWIYLLKHLIKLQDAFDVENFEEELLNIAPPIFINNLKIKLIQFLKNEKLQNIDVEFDFFVDQIYQDYNLIELNNNDNINNYDNNELLITYSKLSLLDKIDVLYNLVKLANTKSYSNFRKIVDKFEKPQFHLKIIPIFTIDNKIKNKISNIRDEYIILQDARLYLRKLEFPKLTNNNNNNREEINLEPKLIQWECLTTNIYQFDELINNLKKSFGKKTSSKEFELSKVLEYNLDFIIQHDLKKRKQSAQRKREIEMQLLMANRKRSSRLEEKEKRKREQEEARLKEFEIIKQKATELRAAKRQKLKDSFYSNSIIIDSSISREERLKKRHELHQNSSTPPLNEIEKNSIGIKSSDDNLVNDNSNEIDGNTEENPVLIKDSPDTSKIEIIDDIEKDKTSITESTDI